MAAHATVPFLPYPHTADPDRLSRVMLVRHN